MGSTGFMLAGLVFAVLAGYRLMRDLVRVIQADRDRRSSLRRLEEDPTADPGPPAEVVSRLDRAVAVAMREDLTLTGAMLAAMSVAAVFGGRAIGYGHWAVGLYTAGLIGIVAGVALALMGGVIRVITLPLHPKDRRA